MKKLFALLSLFLAQYVFSQSEKLGTIEVYGTANASATHIKEVVGLKEGDLIDRSTFDKTAIEQKIRSVPGILMADVTLICCDDKQGHSILYIGVSGDNIPAHAYNKTGSGNIRLDAYVFETYQRYEQVWMDAVKSGQSSENDEQGHVLLSYPPAFSLQDSFVLYAANHVPLLRKVIRESASVEQRQAATWIIPFTNDKRSVVEDLLYAANDPDETVRNNAMRALGVMARYSSVHPSSGITVPASMFIRMLRSIVWTDRNKGAMLLEALTSKRDSSTLRQLRTEALGPLSEMARWKNPGHAFFSLIILGRIAGISDEDIFAALGDENRSTVVEKWMKKINTH